MLPAGLEVCTSALEAAKQADMAVLLTEWPELLSLDYGRLKAVMAQSILFDTKNMLRAQHQVLERLGFRVITIGQA
jgi:UDPglucose 6-dehydrogenase